MHLLVDGKDKLLYMMNLNRNGFMKYIYKAYYIVGGKGLLINGEDNE